MKLRAGVKSTGSVLRFLALILILCLLVPRIFAVCYNLYMFIFNQRDKLPSGNPMKVENRCPESTVTYRHKYPINTQAGIEQEFYFQMWN